MRILVAGLLIWSFNAVAQNKTLTHDDFDRWNQIPSSQISRDGELIVYELQPGKGDGSLHIASPNGKNLLDVPRGEGAKISWDSKYVVFKIKPQYNKVIELRRKKTDEDKMPKDSIGIYDVAKKELTKIARVRGFDLPKESTGMLAYYLEEALPAKDDKSDTTKKKEKPKPSKAVSKDNGFHLVIRSLRSGTQDTLEYITDHQLAKRSNNFIYHTSGKDSTILEGVYYYDLANKTSRPLCRTKGKYKQLAIAEDGLQVAFLSDLDTTKALIRDFELRHWNMGKDSAMVIAKKGTEGIHSDWLVSEHGKLNFSESGSRLFFGTAPAPAIQDTTLLPEEIIHVEVWNYKNSRLHTQQNMELDDDKKKSYLAYFDTLGEKIIQLGTKEIPDVSVANHGESEYALGSSYLPYLKNISWDGFPLRYDIYSINVATGKAKLAKKDLLGDPGLSAEGNYLYWFNAADTTWNSYHNESGKSYVLTKDIPVTLADEENDYPNYPDQYGAAGWTQGDQHFLVYDRFDIWKIDPQNNAQPVNITNGRASHIEYRFEDLDTDETAIDPSTMVLHTFNESSKDEGYAIMKNFEAPKQAIQKAAKFTNLKKAENAETLTYQMENHQVFGNISATNLSFKKPVQISDANPQQKDYAWGTVEMVSWTSLDGRPLDGILYKPANFDPNKKYPMIVNFYRLSSDDLHDHWGVKPHRSTVNAAFYANRGYLVFNPDVKYKTGYPGESAFNCVVSGTTHMIDQGFVDKDKIGLQGHSWGGYQIAYLITQTDLFACAEAGAVVSNMISAYGGIRWWTGLSRMFQYEHGQSRIGATLWEKPSLYIENSPIFYADKVNTPLLLMHNDSDGHVPWYQGIEYYVALRRLNKPVWMLNYKGEPHWPTKWENKRDFNIRMNQFFDHYLMDKPMPEWMAEGIPATEVGINKGLELVEE
ncbi:MAG: prolyl oligopeptidase family serine peptidase [Fulvivirga sp.]|uniref:alpha/beta hydrolase family protein n=1 Tax=Fulvivirga sp. TaxID=1931237 RepID=UPI0032EF46A0